MSTHLAVRSGIPLAVLESVVAKDFSFPRSVGGEARYSEADVAAVVTAATHGLPAAADSGGAG